MPSSFPLAQRVGLTLMGLLLPIFGMALDNPGVSGWVAARPQSSTESLVPTAPWTVWTNPSCFQTNVLTREWNYNSPEEMVQDTIPGEWWPRTNPVYTVPLNNGALKSAAIIIRTRIQYHVVNPIANPHPNDPNDPYPHIYSTRNLAVGEGVSLCAATMNTILPGRPSLPGGGSDYGAGSPDPLYQSNLAAQQTAGMVIVNQQSAIIAIEWTDTTVEKRSAICNNQSRDWGYCALNALAELLPGPDYQQNKFARRLNTGPTNRVEFQAEAYNNIVPRNGQEWGCETYYTGYTNVCYMRARPNSGIAYGSNQPYQSNSPYMTYKVPFPEPRSDLPPVTYYVWIRGWGGSTNDDSVHVDLEGDGVLDALDMSGWDSSVWQWRSIRMDLGRPSVRVSGDAFHTLWLWMREDGMQVDKILLTTDPNYTPSG